MATTKTIMIFLGRVLLALVCFIPDLMIWMRVLLVRVFYDSVLIWSGGLWCKLSAEKYSRGSSRVLGHGGWYVDPVGFRRSRRTVFDAAKVFRESIHVYEVACLYSFMLMTNAILCFFFISDVRALAACLAGVYLLCGPTYWRFAKRLHGALVNAFASTPFARAEQSYEIAEKYMRDKLGFR